MLSLALALTLAAAPTPIAPADATFVLFVRSPKNDLRQLTSFLDAAGRSAPSLRPEVIGRALGEPLGANVLDPASLDEAGVDLSGALTFSSASGGSLLCFKARPAALSRLKSAFPAGDSKPATATHRGSKLFGAAAPNGAWRTGYASKPPYACAASGRRDVRGLLERGAEALAGAGLKSSGIGTGQPAPLAGMFVSGGTRGSFDARPSKTGLVLEGDLKGAALALEKALADDRLARLRAPVPLVVYGRLSRKTIAQAGLDGLQLLPLPSGRRAAPAALVGAIAPLATGSAATLVTAIDPTASPSAEAFLFSQALALEIEDPAAATAALTKAAQALEAEPVDRTRPTNVADAGTPAPKAGADAAKPGSGSDFALAINGRRVYAGIVGRFAYFANDRDARDRLLTALAALPSTAKNGAPAGSPAPHSLTAVLDGDRAARALRRISLLDLARSPLLAGLFAASMEVGPLLESVEPIELVADPAADGIRFRLALRLAP